MSAIKIETLCQQAQEAIGQREWDTNPLSHTG